MKNLIIGQSGGPTAVINASLYGAIREWQASGESGCVYGMINGIEGLLAGTCMNLSRRLSEEDLELLKLTPAAYLGSCRFKLPADQASPVYDHIFRQLEDLDAGYFLYVGGNDSMDTVDKLARHADSIGSGIRFIGIPKTIDNDLMFTDHTPGYGSAARYVASTVREIVLDASVYRQKSVTIVEIMGRHAGWLTAASVLARKESGDNPLLICLPEIPFDTDAFCSRLEKAMEQTPNVVVCVSEGIADASGTFICEYGDSAKLDGFGHKMLTGCGKILENIVRDRLGVKVRSIELNVNQRCSGMLASETDLEEAAMAGAFGVQAALRGETGKMAAFRREKGTGYHLSCVLEDVSKICNQEKKFPGNWIHSSGCDILPEFLDYVMPLIQGQPEHQMEHGLPRYLYRK